MSKYKLLFQVFKDTITTFFDYKVLKMSASLAYTTIFSMAPLLLVLLYLCDFFFSRQAIEGAIFAQTNAFIGPNAALQLQTMIQGLSASPKSTWEGIIGFVTLIIGATSVFAEIQDSINTIWDLQPKAKSGLWLYLKSRLLSFGVIGSLGFVLLVSLGFSTILDYANKEFFVNFTFFTKQFLYAVDFLVTTIIITLLFGSIFTILPDAKIAWKQVKVASITTAFLFMTGKFLISYYISRSNLTSIYGAAGSFVILMLWVYYSAVILYFGAVFSKCYAVKFAQPIVASPFAEIVQTVKVGSDIPTIQKAQQKKNTIKKIAK